MAAEATRTSVKLAGSINPAANAALVSREFAAKQKIAIVVSRAVWTVPEKDAAIMTHPSLGKSIVQIWPINPHGHFPN
jgi:hypothetical protein